MTRRDFFKNLLVVGVALSTLQGLPIYAQGEPTESTKENTKKKWDSLTPEEKQKVKDRWQKFKTLPLPYIKLYAKSRTYREAFCDSNAPTRINFE